MTYLLHILWLCFLPLSLTGPTVNLPGGSKVIGATAQKDANSTNSTAPTFDKDCLNLNVQRPANATANSKLPVVFWAFGGGFELGSTQSYDATQLINTSVAQGKDIVYVAANYRVGGFGFMPGKEVLADLLILAFLTDVLSFRSADFFVRLFLNPYLTAPRAYLAALAF